MLDSLKSKAAHTAKRAGLLTGGLLAIGVGVAFLTAAGWIYLAAVTDAQTAAIILGGAYAGVGLVLVGVALSGGSQGEQATDHMATRQGDDRSNAQPPLMQAFMHGMQAGVTATQSRR